MNGLEGHKGHKYQTQCTLYAVLKLWPENNEFTFQGEPPRSNDDASIADISINLSPIRKKIQIKKTTDGTTTKAVLKEFISDYISNEEIECELWFSDCYSETTPTVIKELEKVQDSTIHKIRNGGIKGKIKGKNVKIHLDETINEFEIDGEDIKIASFEELDNNGSKLESSIATKYGIEKKHILTGIKTILDDTAEYRKYKLVQTLGMTGHLKSKLLQPKNTFFDRVKITKIHRNNILDEIQHMLPQNDLNLNKREILRGYLLNYISDNMGRPIMIHEIKEQIIKCSNEFFNDKNYVEIQWERNMTGDVIFLTLLESPGKYKFNEEVPGG